MSFSTRGLFAHKGQSPLLTLSNLRKVGRRLAIRAAKFQPKPTSWPVQWVKNPPRRNFTGSKKRGAIEGPIRIPLRSLSFLFNALGLPIIPSNSLKFRPVVFSTPTRFRHSLLLLKHLGPERGNSRTLRFLHVSDGSISRTRVLSAFCRRPGSALA